MKKHNYTSLLTNHMMEFQRAFDVSIFYDNLYLLKLI